MSKPYVNSSLPKDDVNPLASKSNPFAPKRIDPHAEIYIRGVDPEYDKKMQRINRARCSSCDKKYRPRRCGGCPVRTMKKIVLYIPPFLPRPA